MNVGKLLLAISILIISGLSIHAQNVQYNWHEGIVSKNSIAPSSLEIDREGNLFTLTNFTSLTASLTAEYMGQTFSGVRNTATSGNRNLLLVKSDLSGNFIWGVNSMMGDVDVSASSMVLTNDGGVFLALKIRHTNKNELKNDTILGIKDATGAITKITMEYPSGWIYQAALVKISADGAVEWTKFIPVDYSPMANASSTYSTYTPDGFYFYDGTTDNEGNLYIAGNIRKYIAFGTDTVRPHNVDAWNGDSQNFVGNAFVVKLDNSGNYVWDFTTEGSSVYDNIKGIEHADGALYIAGLQKGDGNDFIVGDETLTTPQQVNMWSAKLNLDKTISWTEFYPGIVANGKNAIQMENLSLKDGFFYLTGGMQGGIGYTRTATESDLSSGGTMYNGYVLKCSIADGSCKGGAIRSGTAIGKTYGVVASADSIFVFGYDWGGSGHNVYLDSYDHNLNAGTQYPLLNGGGMATAWDITAIEDTVFILTRAAKNSAVSFLGTTETFTATDNWAGLTSSFIFPGRNFTDETAPTTPTELVGTPTVSSIILTWTASTDNVEVAGYNVYVDGEFNQTVAIATATISGLEENTSYVIEVEAYDKAGNKLGKAEITISTIESADEEAPTIPTDLDATASETSIELTWTASTDNKGVVGYNIYLNDVFNHTVTSGTTATISNLAPSTSYKIEVEAIDAAENKSEKADITVKTLGSVGFNNVLNVQIEIYPNPFADYLIIEASDKQTVGLYNLSGQCIITKEVCSGSNYINTSSLPAGIYTLKIGNKTFKVIK
ncbi:fibronectin type III domain-containing protein [Paludibacteraceae bacterium OttesenSCG-928-F17]|nr:fibronectin type III domain-containing protein [Paludibacteraceae bacterium OttesenSCG-928-F17]